MCTLIPLILLVSSMAFAATIPQTVFPSLEDADNRFEVPMTAITGMASGIATAASRPDIALANSLITPNHLKGEVGERAMGEYLTRHLRETGNWIPIYSKQGAIHGIDGIFIKMDNRGMPRGIIVGESKYGTSQLSKTQLTEKWVGKRLAGLSSRYGSVGTALQSREVQFGVKLPETGARHVIEIPLDGKRKLTFWREDANKPWKCATIPVNKDEALNASRRMEQYLRGAAEGRIEIKKYIYNTKFEGNNLIVKVDRVTYDSQGQIVKTKMPLRKIALSTQDVNRIRTMTIEELSKFLKKKLPHLTQRECKAIATRIATGKDVESILAEAGSNVGRQVILNSLKVGALGGVLSGLEELYSQWRSGEYELARVLGKSALGFGAAASSYAIGNAVTMAATESALASRLASGLGYGSVSIGSNILGVSSGFLAFSLFYAYAGALAGLHNFETANIMAGTGAVGAAAFLATAPTLMAVASAFGTASTGTAISTLYGAAATNASLAWLGGAGGLMGTGTVAAGTAVIGVASLGIGLVVTAVAGLGVTWYYSHYSNERFAATLEAFRGLPYYQACAPPPSLKTL